MDRFAVGRIARAYMRRVAAARPDNEWDVRDPKAPALSRTLKARRHWHVVRELVSAFETTKGEFVVVLSDKGYGKLSGAAKAGTRWEYGTPRGFYITKDEDAGAIFHEHPEWREAYKVKTGRTGEEGLPYEYREILMAKGELPIKSGFDLEQVLKRDGWKATKERGHLQKKFGIVRVLVVVPESHFSKKLDLRVLSLPKGLVSDDDRFNAFWEDTSFTFPDFTKVSVDEINRKAVELAARVKKWRPKREKPTHDRFRWQGESGPQAFKKWQAAIREALVEDLQQLKRRAPRHDPYWPTSLFVSDLWDNRNMEPQSVMLRDEFSKRVRAELEKLARAGKVEKITELGREVYWEWIG
jgi:hypothetical protein